jgi:GNAT superfamily N-acetyltransferase
MEIVKAGMDRLEDVRELLSAAVKEMNERGVTQWDENYPGLDLLIGDIRTGSMFLMIDDGTVIGMIVLTGEQEPEYMDVDWSDKEGKAAIIHRAAVHPSLQGKGIGSKLFDFAEEYALKNGFSSIRIDTFSENPNMQRLIESKDYVRRGTIHFPTHKPPFICYEKILR